MLQSAFHLGDDNLSFAISLAEWITLPSDKVGVVYLSVRPEGPSRAWATLIGMTEPAHLILEACKEAETHGFISEFAQAVIRTEEGLGRDAADSRELVQANPGLLGTGIIQALIDEPRGLINARILPKIVKATQACARVVVLSPQLRPLGTAFLVRPDIVMTAAHVVLDRNIETGEWGEELLANIAFEFSAEPPSNPLIRVFPRSQDALLSFAKPHCTVQGDLHLSDDPPANDNLDFALIQLEQPVPNLPLVPIDEQAAVEVNEVCWAFGFPPGADLAFDVNKVVQKHSGSGRWRHKANTVHGMSGGVCINHFGQLAGIHEGGVIIPGHGHEASDAYNRGITIEAIRRKQLASGQDPLTISDSGPQAGIFDGGLVTQLYRVGMALSPGGYAQSWEVAVEQVVGAIPNGTVSVSDFHPWFHRRSFEDWLEDKSPQKRLAFILGERGTGKSFCADILREKLDYEDFDLLHLDLTRTREIDWKDTLASAIDAQDSRYRTGAASMRYSGADAVIEELLKRASHSGRKRYVVLDFGHENFASGFDRSPWFELVAKLLMNSWVRIVLIGLNEGERNSLLDRILFDPMTRDIVHAGFEMRHITKSEFTRFAIDLALSQGKPNDEATIRPMVDAVFEDLTATEKERLQTCGAALMGIQLGRGYGL